MLTKNIILLILALCCLLPLHAAESATAVLDKAAAKIRASKSLSASYTITADTVRKKLNVAELIKLPTKTDGGIEEIA